MRTHTEFAVLIEALDQYVTNLGELMEEQGMNADPREILKLRAAEEMLDRLNAERAAA